MPYGAARPRLSPRKSWMLTVIGSRLQVWPGCLKSPINSFFLLSTLMIGCPAAVNVAICSSMWANWTSRSGWFERASSCLLLTCSEYSNLRSRRPTVGGLSAWPASFKRSLNVLRLLRTHFWVLIGSPAVSGVTSASSVDRIRGVFFPRVVGHHQAGARGLPAGQPVRLPALLVHDGSSSR